MNAVGWIRMGAMLGAALLLAGRSVAQEPARSGAPMSQSLAESTRISVGGFGDDLADVAIDAATYRVGPGDRLIVTTWGNVNGTHILVVTPEGRVLVPGSGPVAVGGLSLRDVRDRIERVMHTRVRGSEVFVDLQGIRRFKVYVTGLVQRPQAMRAAATLRVSEVIDRAGGFTGQAAQRGVRVEHADGTVDLADIAGFATAGLIDGNVFVREGDVIVVPARGAAVQVDGAVGLPGTYDLMAGDTAGKLLRIAGGAFPGVVLEEAEFYHFDGARMIGPTRLDLSSPVGLGQPLSDGDRIYLRKPSSYGHVDLVSLAGEVTYTGPYALTPGETLRELLVRAGGMTANADSSGINIDRRELASPASDEVFGLQRLDPARLRDSDLELTRLVSAGRAGRFTADFVLHPTDREIVLRDGDRIEVPRAARQVRVAGEVRRPGLFAYTPGAAVTDYIDLAGGYTQHADRGHVRVSKPRGWHTVEGEDGAPLEQGDVVWVFAKPRSVAWTRARDIVGFVAQVATIYLVIRNSNATTP